MPDSLRVEDPLLLDADSLSASERNFRLNWVMNRQRSAKREPMLCPEYVVHQGRRVRIVDIRAEEELMGPQGYIPGVDWVPEPDAFEVLRTLPRNEPLVLVSRDGLAARELAKRLEDLGFLLVGAMIEGMLGWRHLGFSIARKRDVLESRDQLRKISPEPDFGSPISLDDIVSHVGDPFEVKWVRMAGLLLQGRHHCVDGRDDSGIVGTPGGDAGEFLSLLSCFETELGRSLTHDEVGGIFHHVLDAFGAFYVHTDALTVEKLVRAIRADDALAPAVANVHGAEAWRRFFDAPPEALRDAVLEHMLLPEHQGCGHLKLLLTKVEEYGVRRGLADSFLRHFFTSRWNGADECEHVILAGEHDEKGVLVVRIDTEIFPFTQIPLVSPMCHNSQMFVSHPQVASYYRGQLAEFICRLPDVLSIPTESAARIRVRSDELAEKQTMSTLTRLAAGLPIYEVTFRIDGRVDVAHGGDVPSRT